MSDNTLFLNTLIYAFPDNTPDPFYSRDSDSFEVQNRYNVVVQRVQSLSPGGGYGITPALADWDILILKVIGSAQLQTTGKDTDGTTTITGLIDGYGTAVYPGYIVLSTYNLSAIVITGADATVQIFYCKSEDDA